MSDFKGLIFDLDGTLTLSQHFHYQSFGEIFQLHGIPYTVEDDYRHSGKGSHTIFPAIFEEHGEQITEEQIEEMSQKKKEIYEKIVIGSRVEAVPGVQDFLTRMHQKGIPMIVATGNKQEFIEMLLSKAKIPNFFQDIVTNKEVEHSKPEPDIFLKAAEKLHLDPSECIVFEDAANGILAAESAEMPCVALMTGMTREELEDAGADLVVQDYTEITDEMLRNLINLGS